MGYLHAVGVAVPVLGLFPAAVVTSVEREGVFLSELIPKIPDNDPYRSGLVRVFISGQ